MNYIKHLAGFFDRVAADERLNPTHVSMYVSLFQFWNANRFQNPISISRNEVMKVSKISAKATYHKCMKELNDWQYLKYKPSYNPFKGSLVYLFNFQSGEMEKNEPPNLFNSQTSVEQALVANHTKIETSTEQAQEPYINVSKRNKQNSINLGKQKQKNDVQKLNKSKKQSPISPSPLGEGWGEAGKKEKSCVKKEKTVFVIPTSIQVQEYFQSQSYPLTEAQKFYNYFQSNGWLVGGRTKMRDWHAAARNWMLNAQKFAKHSFPTDRAEVRQPKAQKLYTKHDKNYNEPL
jgi:hypothetical protein